MHSEQFAADLVRQWRGGDQQAWEPLSLLIKQALVRRTGTFFPRLDTAERDKLEALVLILFDHLVAEGRIDLTEQSHFHKMCALAMRRILVEISRSPESGEEILVRLQGSAD